MSSTDNDQTYDGLSDDVIVLGTGPAARSNASGMRLPPSPPSARSGSGRSRHSAASPRAATGQAPADQQAFAADTPPNVLSLG
jgi:hypothetical protein